MHTTSPKPAPREERASSSLTVRAILHPQGCHAYLLADSVSKQALALDVHLDLVDEIDAAVREAGLTLPYVVDSHTHADHPSGAAELAARFSSTRIAHEKAEHVGVARHPADGDTLHLGDQVVHVRHAPGHSPDHMALQTADALFTGDSLFIGSVARTDFLGGDAGQLFDSIHRLLDGVPDGTLMYPGHDYAGREHSSVGVERRDNPWLGLDRDAFVEQLTANPPTRPSNMDALLRLNRDATAIPAAIPAAEVIAQVRGGGALSVIDVRTGGEYAAEHVEGTHLIPLDQVTERLDEIRAIPAPRLILCRTGSRAVMARNALAPLGIAGLTVIDGGIEAYSQHGGETVKGKGAIPLDRQMRIIAGSLVLLGAVLGAWVSPAFYALSAFVGAGLVFAGITDICPMMMGVAKLPWNRTTHANPPAAGGCSATVGGCSATLPSPTTTQEA